MAAVVPGRQERGAGFFGKLSSHGDFVSRRLPSSFTAVWDEWLQTSIGRSRELLGPAWMNAYLSAPVWRFALSAGLCGHSAWAGVLMPSVDRVGRCFPLTVAMALPPDAALLALPEQACGWYADMEQLALSSLDQGFTLERFDAALRATDLPRVSRAQAEEKDAARGGFLRLAIPDLDGLSLAMPALRYRIAEACVAGQSLWWSQGSDWVAPSMVLCRGLPGEAAFTAMLRGFLERDGSLAS